MDFWLSPIQQIFLIKAFIIGRRNQFLILIFFRTNKQTKGNIKKTKRRECVKGRKKELNGQHVSLSFFLLLRVSPPLSSLPGQHNSLILNIAKEENCTKENNN